MHNISTTQLIVFLKWHRRLIEQDLANTDWVLTKLGDPVNKSSTDTAREINWPKVVEIAMGRMKDWHSKAEITAEVTNLMGNYVLYRVTIKNKVAAELLINKNILKKRIGKTYKYCLKNK